MMLQDTTSIVVGLQNCVGRRAMRVPSTGQTDCGLNLWMSSLTENFNPKAWPLGGARKGKGIAGKNNSIVFKGQFHCF